MRVKKFEAKSMKEALTMVKRELGPDAVILAARDNKRFGLAGEASVEVTAAVSESTLQKKRFTESRMTAQAREKFATSDARTQRQIIEKMIENRQRQTKEEAQPRRSITSVSYIDIPDEEEIPGSRRKAAFDRAKGRNVTDLLEDFDQDFDVDQWQARSTREAAVSAPIASSASPEERQPTEKAKARIRDAAREAWRSNPFLEEERAAREAQARAAARQAAKAQAQQASAQLQAQPPAASQARGPAPAPAPATVRNTGGVEVIREAAPAAQAPVAQQVMPQPDNAEISTLKSEITRLQKMLEGFQKVPQSFVTMHPGAEYGIPYDLSFMYQKLMEAGLNIENTVEILQAAAREIDPLQIKKRPIVDAWVARWFLNSIQVSQTPFQGRVHLFVGGAGSGKTSALVKMASHLVVKEKKKVAILSTDSFKVGAVDQLKIYCQILNVPFAVIRNRKDWEWVLGQLRHVDHVLVDYPGLQLRDLDEIHLLKSLLPPEGTAPVCHFCVAATAKDGDAYEIARRYRVADYGDVIFTNLDQSVQHGIIYNLQKKTGKPLHSFGIGNRIPEDFEVASKERVLDLIFKLTKLKRETR